MKFLFGVLVGLVVVGVAAAVFAGVGLFNAAASVPPTAIETKVARFALDASVGRRAPKVSNRRSRNPDPARGVFVSQGGPPCRGCVPFS